MPAPGEGKHPADTQARRYRALLGVSDAIALHQELPELFHDLARRLRRILSFDLIYFVLHNSANNTMRLSLVESEAGLAYELPVELPLDQAAGGYVFSTQEPLLLSDIGSEARFPAVLGPLRQSGIRSLCLLPLSTAQHRLGAMAFGSNRPQAYDAADLEFLQRVAEQVAVAVDSGLYRQQVKAYEQQLASERDHARLLLELNNVLVAKLEMHELFAAISRCLRGLLQHDYASLVLYEGGGQFRLHALDFPEGRGLVREDFLFAVEGSPGGVAFTTRKPLLLDRLEFERFPSEITLRMIQEGVKSACWLPLITRNGVLGTLSLASLTESTFHERDMDLLAQVAGQVAIALENALAFQQIQELKDKLAEEKLYLEDEIRSEYNFEDIVGESPSWKQVLDQVRTVAPTEATVLILGETGTGKELIARAIHSLSARSDRTFVKLNCSAIPTGLLESELFGHEKGAFTGAIAQKIGRFELADHGTLFLDEVGDIPAELQPKLLRALQEQEFERLGSNRTQRVNVRLLAATNRNLGEMVSAREFRSDLYYRLNVFPVRVPPLRERVEDIPTLVRYFAQKYSRRMGRNIQRIPTETMHALTRWDWPGNVRELENLVERAVILSPGPVLHVPLAELKPVDVPSAAADLNSSSLEEAERQHILRVLRETKGVIAGPRGAAAKLGLKRTTLNYKMKKLGIRHKRA